MAWNIGWTIEFDSFYIHLSGGLAFYDFESISDKNIAFPVEHSQNIDLVHTTNF